MLLSLRGIVTANQNVGILIGRDYNTSIVKIPESMQELDKGVTREIQIKMVKR